jgi:hypothetical protein
MPVRTGADSSLNASFTISVEDPAGEDRSGPLEPDRFEPNRLDA